MRAGTVAEPVTAGSETGAVQTRFLRVHRHHWRLLGIVSAIIAAIVVVFVVTRNATLLSNAMASAVAASPLWLVACTLAIAASFVAAAVGVVGAVQGQVPVGRTVAAELAGTFCNRLTPAGVGRTALRARYLVCAGLSVERAASAVALSSIVGAVVYLCGLSAASMLTQDGSPISMAVSPGGVAVFCCSVVLIAFLAVEVSSHRWRQCARRHRWKMRIRNLGRELRDLSRDPWAMTALLAGPLLASAAYVVAFWAALHSVGATIGITSAAMVYVSATAVATAVPVPGGIGAAEITLTAGLTTAGISPGTALSGVLVFRLISLWLPSGVGAFTLIWLRRVGALSTDGSPGGHPLPLHDRLVSLRGRLGAMSTPKKLVVAGGAMAAVAVLGTGSAMADPDPAPTNSAYVIGESQAG